MLVVELCQIVESLGKAVLTGPSGMAFAVAAVGVIEITLLLVLLLMMKMIRMAVVVEMVMVRLVALVVVAEGVVVVAFEVELSFCTVTVFHTKNQLCN